MSRPKENNGQVYPKLQQFLVVILCTFIQPHIGEIYHIINDIQFNPSHYLSNLNINTRTTQHYNR